MASDSATRFRALFDAELPYVIRTLQRLGVPPDDVDDLAQEVFVAVHRRLGDYDPRRPIRPWLVSFAVRVVANYRRLARHRREQVGIEGAVKDNRRGLDQELSDRQLVLHALDAIGEERRHVFILRHLDGVAVEDIAAGLALPVNTIYSRLRKAQQEFTLAARRLGARRGA